MTVGRRILQSYQLMWHQWCVRSETSTRQGKSVILAATRPRERGHISRTKDHIYSKKFQRRWKKGSKDSYTKFQIFRQKWGMQKSKIKNMVWHLATPMCRRSLATIARVTLNRQDQISVFPIIVAAKCYRLVPLIGSGPRSLVVWFSIHTWRYGVLIPGGSDTFLNAIGELFSIAVGFRSGKVRVG